MNLCGKLREDSKIMSSWKKLGFSLGFCYQIDENEVNQEIGLGLENAAVWMGRVKDCGWNINVWDVSQ